MLPRNIRRNDPCPCGSGKRYKGCHGAFEEGGKVESVAGIPAAVRILLHKALASHQQHDYVAASAYCQRILGIDRHCADAWHLSGVIDLERGDHKSAATKIARAVEINPAQADFHKDLARAKLAVGSIGEASASARRALELDSANSEAWVVLGLTTETAEPSSALAAWEKATALSPRDPEAYFRIGNFHRRRGNFNAAVASYRAALAVGSGHPVLLNNLGLALQQLEEFKEAEQCYRSAIQQQPTLLEANANLADLCLRQNRFADAAAYYNQALALNPKVAQLWLNLGVCQHQQGALSSAQTSFERAHALDPSAPQTMVNMAAVLLAQQRDTEAIPFIRKALALQPDLVEAESMLLYANQQTCHWEDFDRLFERQRAALRGPNPPLIVPHNLLALPYTPAEFLAAARNWVQQKIRPKPAKPPTVIHLVANKLRVAYLGSDFRTHPLANLLTEVIERHDRSRFEVFAYSFGPNDRSYARERFVAAFDRFTDVKAETFEETAQRIRDDQIAILFDTGGYVMNARSEIFALRPAPIQINCIGFPGTLGADYYDYILTDEFVTPRHQQIYFPERFMYLPHCYMPGDTRRAMGAIPTRERCRLPDASFVFCCFNSSYKIHPDVFEIWMRLLEQIPDSVLWLLDANSTATGNLRQEARRRNVSEARLIFAPRVSLAEHLARHSVADLFLDTFPCNAHTTTNDALFAGLPVLTCAGETFASRVSGSHLHAIGLPDLVTHNLQDYATLARKLALEPNLLQSYRAQLRANRVSHPLFDTIRYTRALEESLWAAWDEWVAANKRARHQA